METWVCDAGGDPVLVVMAQPGASLAMELRRLLPDLRAAVGDQRRVLVGFDRGGWSPALFAHMHAEGFDVLTWRKGTAENIDATQFAEDEWDLSALVTRPVSHKPILRFSSINDRLRPDTKHLCLLMLTQDLPTESLDRKMSSRARVAPTTLATQLSDLTPFLAWCQQSGVRSFSEVTEAELDAYAKVVRATDTVAETQGRRLNIVSKLWLFAPYMRLSARLRRPPWEVPGGIDAVVGVRKTSAENLTRPIHPATISPLLMWSLRVIDDAPAAIQEMDRCRRSTQPRGGQANQKWLGELAYLNPAQCRVVIAAACVITVTYLTGIRPQEVTGLERGCCAEDPMNRGAYLIRGRTFKNARDEHGRLLSGGQMRRHAWRAVKPVADAIAIIETLHDGTRLFPRWVFDKRDSAVPSEESPLRASNEWAINPFCNWAMSRATQIGEPPVELRRDESGQVTLNRMRRTLAWFIYRQPLGRVALGIQYGHIHAATTDGYGNRASAGLRDVFEVERALALRDNLEHAANQLDAGSTVSGPAADRYVAAARDFSVRYKGMVLTDFKAVRDLLANRNLQIYDGPDQMLACKFDPKTALCRSTKLRGNSEMETPDLLGCRPECTNIARTDEHIARIQVAADAIKSELKLAATPMPMRARLEAQLERYESTVREHESSQGNESND